MNSSEKLQIGVPSKRDDLVTMGTLCLGENTFEVEYKTVFKATSSARIKNKKIIISLSRFLPAHYKQKTIEKFLNWAAKRLSKIKQNDFVSPVYKDSGRIVTHNKIYEIQVVDDDRKNISARLKEGSVIRIFLNSKFTGQARAKKIKQLAEKVIMEDQEIYLKEIMDELNQMYFQERYNFCRFKRSNSRFGSCSGKRNINISFRLLFAPREVFRYVCAHELAHLKEMNHSKKFWDVVRAAVPDYKNSEKWLKMNGFLLE